MTDLAQTLPRRSFLRGLASLPLAGGVLAVASPALAADADLFALIEQAREAAAELAVADAAFCLASERAEATLGENPSREARRRSQETPEYDSADLAFEDAIRAEQDLWYRIAALPATTAEGIVAKLEIAASYFDGCRGGIGETVLISAAFDARRRAAGGVAMTEDEIENLGLPAWAFPQPKAA